jgi:hypothetical protein
MSRWLFRLLQFLHLALPDTTSGDVRPEALPVLRNEPIPRYPCPFLGGVGVFIRPTIFVFAGPEDDYNSNGCALKCEHSPCEMEREALMPNWDECQLFNQPSNKALLHRCFEGRCYPHEFRPLGQTSWDGIQIADYARYVMSDQCPRPPELPWLARKVQAEQSRAS